MEYIYILEENEYLELLQIKRRLADDLPFAIDERRKIAAVMDVILHDKTIKQTNRPEGP